MKGLVLGSVAALALLACVSVAGAASEIRHGSVAARPIANGKLAYSSSDGARHPFYLYAVNPDGSRRRILARCRSRDCQIGAYAWSPSGKRLAFLRGTLGGKLPLFVVGADGKREKRVAGCGKPKLPCGDFSSRLSWSLGGSRLVVTRGGALFILNVDRGGVRRLTSCGGAASCFDRTPSWAPRGEKIVFVRSGSVYSVKTDGSDLTRLTNLAGFAANPAWSPDGSRIAFDVSGVGVGDKIYAMAADGSELTLLGTAPSGSGPGRPFWSPDGTKVVYFNTPGSPGEYTAEVWVVKADGSEPRRLYEGRCCVGTWAAPIWSPDGRYIAFGVGSLYPDQFTSGIFIMRADGTQLRKLTTDVAEVTWQRKPSRTASLARKQAAVKGS